MKKESWPCGQCGREIKGFWKPVSGWVKMEWSDTEPVKMRIKKSPCPYCNTDNEIIEIAKLGTSKIKINFNAKKKTKA